MLALLGEWGMCMGEAVGGLRPVLFVLVWFGFAFFSQRESCRAERELSCIQERVGGLGIAVGGEPKNLSPVLSPSQFSGKWPILGWSFL